MRTWRCWLMLGPFAMACTNQLDFPPGAQVRCGGNDECPSGRVCRQSRCVDASLESEQPTISNVSLGRLSDGAVVPSPETPARFAPGQVVVVGFDVSEPLGEDPRVQLQSAGAPNLDLGDCDAPDADCDETSYQFQLTVTSELAGFATLTIEVVDRAGNLGSVVLPNRVEFDRTPPTVLGAPAVVYSSGPSSLLQRLPRVATLGTTVEVSLTFNEPLDAEVPPTLVAVNGASTLAFTPTIEENPFFEFAAVVEPGAADGDYALRVTATDRAGNETPEPLVPAATLRVDTSPPTPPSNLLLVRRPWGDAAACAPSVTLAADDESLPVSSEVETSDAGQILTTLVVFDRPGDAADRVELGRTPLQPDGTLEEFVLNTGDRTTVYAILLDAAGNESESFRVERGRWHGNLNGRRPGRDFSNPSRLTVVAREEPALLSAAATEPPAGVLEASYVCSDDGRGVPAETTRTWTRLDGPSPPPTLFAGIAHMASIAKTFLYGGFVSEGASNNFFEWDGVRWREVDLTGRLAPPAVLGPSMSYDPIRDRVVLFGGGASLTTLNRDVWEWDGERWSRAVTTGPSPFSAVALPMTFDPGRGLTTLFGDLVLPEDCGSLAEAPLLVGPCVSREVWTWDGADWRSACDEACQDTGPAARVGASVAYDPVSDRVLLFGGLDSAASAGAPDVERVPNDTWAWDGTQWSQLEAPAAGREPSGRAFGNMVYAPAQGGVLLFGGCADPASLFECGDLEADGLGNVWRWSGGTWELFDALPRPEVPSRQGAMAAVDTGRGEIVWVGGSFKAVELTAQGADCESQPPCPNGRAPVELGAPEQCTCWLDSTHIAQGSDALAWELRAGEGGRIPGATREMASVQLPDTDVVFSMGGRDAVRSNCDGTGREGCNTLWRFDGAWKEVWTPSVLSRPYDDDECGVVVSGTATEPCPADDAALGYVSGAGASALVFFSGVSRGCEVVDCERYNTWLYPLDGSAAWSTIGDEDAIPVRPAPRRETAYASAPVGGGDYEFFVFGGETRVDAAEPCPPDTATSALSDSDSGRRNCLHDALWRLSLDASGPAWSLVPVSGNAPTARKNAGMTYDPLADRLLLFGGCTNVADDCGATGGSDVLGDLWAFDLDTLSWSSLSQQDPPSPREGAALGVDTVRGRLLLFGGEAGEAQRDDALWEYNPSTSQWQAIPPEGVAPTPRLRHVIEYLESSESMLMFGDGDIGEYWSRDLSVDTRAGIVVELAWSAAGFADPDNTNAARDVVDRWTLEIAASGVGYDVAPVETGGVGAPVNGFEVEAWDSASLSWTPLAAASGSGVQTLNITRAGDDARRLVFPGTGNVYVRVVPVRGSGNGPEGARVELDAVELRVDYHLP